MIAFKRTNTCLVALLSLAVLGAVVTTACSGGSAPVREPTPLPTATIAAAVPTEAPTAAPTVAPTSPPVAAPAVASPSALRPIAPTTFLVGNTLGRGMTLRREPMPTEAGTHWPDGTRMEGLGAERSAYGWTWLWVRDPNSDSGWMPSEFLVPADGNSAADVSDDGSSRPLPSTPTRLATPPAPTPPAATAPARPAATAPTHSAAAAPAAPAPPAPPSMPSVGTPVRAPVASTASVIVSGQTVVASGRSSMKTKPFALSGGSYTIAWQGRGSGNCIGRLPPIDGSSSHSFLNVIIKEPQRGETQVYGVKPGQYYLDMSCDDWAVAIVPQGQDALAALDTAPVPAASQAATAPAAAIDWALAFDRIEPLTQAAVANEYGNYRRQVATGVFQRIFFRVQNRQKKSDTISASELTLTDAQGRTYSTDFQVRQVQAGGSSAAFDGVSIVPEATVALIVVFDVTPDATGLVLHMRGGNDVKVN